MNKTHIMMHFRAEDLPEYFARSEAVAKGEEAALPEKFRKFLSTRDFPEKPLGQL